jgi:hypothetical protein
MKILPILGIFGILVWLGHIVADSVSQLPPQSECSPPGRHPVDALGPKLKLRFPPSEEMSAFRVPPEVRSLYDIVLNTQRLLILVYSANVRDEYGGAYRRLVRALNRSTMCRHDWRVYHLVSLRFAVKDKRNRCACWVACFIDVRVLTQVAMVLIEFERCIPTAACSLPSINYTPAQHRGGGHTRKYMPSQINPFLANEYEPLAAGARLMYHPHGLSLEHGSRRVCGPRPFQGLGRYVFAEFG